jgi:hypothetical protein
MISYPAILITIFLATQETLNAIEKPSDKQLLRWLGRALIAVNGTLVVIYSLFLWKTPEFVYAPQNIPEAVFKFIAFSFGSLLCAVVCRAYLAYFPLEKSPVIRLKVLMIILCAFSACAYFLTKIAQIGGYVWPWLASPTVNHISLAFLVLSSLLYFGAFLSNKLYVRFMVVSRNIRSWKSFQHLKYLIEHILRLCPVVALSPNDPPFWRFLLNPEYYLYNAIVIILDGKSMLADFLSEGITPGQPALWEDDLLEEAIRINDVLQAVSQSDDFWEIVGEYSRASQSLFQNSNFALDRIYDIN